jgi:hypothetical protein
MTPLHGLRNLTRQTLDKILCMWIEGEYQCDFLEHSEPPHLSISKRGEVVLEEPVATRLEATERSMDLLRILRTGILK